MRFYKIAPWLLQRAVWGPLRPFFRFFLHLRIEGVANLKNLPPGVIFAVNHSSEWDPVLVPAALPFTSPLFPFFYLSRDKSFYGHLGAHARLLYGGFFFKLWGSYPVSKGIGDYKKALSVHARFLKDGNSICIFPEGYMTKTGTLGKGHGGVAYLSWVTAKPVLPVYIKNVWRMTLTDIITRKRNVTIRFGVPLYPRELFGHSGDTPRITEKRNDFSVVAELVMDQIKRMQ